MHNETSYSTIRKRGLPIPEKALTSLTTLIATGTMLQYSQSIASGIKIGLETLQFSFYVDDKPPVGHPPVVFFDILQCNLSIHQNSELNEGDFYQSSDPDEHLKSMRKSRHSKSSQRIFKSSKPVTPLSVFILDSQRSVLKLEKDNIVAFSKFIT